VHWTGYDFELSPIALHTAELVEQVSYRYDRRHSVWAEESELR